MTKALLRSLVLLGVALGFTQSAFASGPGRAAEPPKPGHEAKPHETESEEQRAARLAHEAATETKAKLATAADEAASILARYKITHPDRIKDVVGMGERKIPVTQREMTLANGEKHTTDSKVYNALKMIKALDTAATDDPTKVEGVKTVFESMITVANRPPESHKEEGEAFWSLLAAQGFVTAQLCGKVFKSDGEHVAKTVSTTSLNDDLAILRAVTAAKGNAGARMLAVMKEKYPNEYAKKLEDIRNCEE
ncbi:MAG: hypothetical protein C5B49_13125 [Bdellovibrio sp.]|nr:MAG: hypothetical protein C5B49_13125 [Bdellovibrio sp.]